MTNYPEINRHGLTEYHRQSLCYPFTDVPAFKFWGEPITKSPPGTDLMRTWQDGRCGLCGFRADRLVEDHCHVSGLVRGLLCRSCNTSEGLSDHGMEQWRNGVTVAAALGVEKVYVSAHTPTRIYAAVSDDALDRVAEAAVR